MDISTFRWILIILGIAIIVGIFLLGNPDKRPRRSASRRHRKNKRKKAQAPPPERQEPTLDGGTDAVAEDLGAAHQAELQIDNPTPTPTPTSAPAATETRAPLLEKPPEKVVMLYLRARDNHSISGLDLLDSALKSGMVFGAHDIFHRQLDGESQPLFSMANLTNPGTFDKDAWNTMETKGVTMFLALPGPLGALDAWDAMLATSRRLAELMHADLLDDAREVFTRQREGQIREELREFERDQQPEQ